MSQEAITGFANKLFEIYPSFVPTKSLYLDLEGRNKGFEDILSLYWPRLRGNQRFAWIKREQARPISHEQFKELMKSLKAIDVESVVVFSSGQNEPDEKVRLTKLFGDTPLPDQEWVNLHFVIKKCRVLKQDIREHMNVWHCNDKSRIRYSLEALEWEFGIQRPPLIRSHSNCYKDLDGETGEMEVLSVAKRSIDQMATAEEEATLREYCEADVKNMFDICNRSEHMAFSKIARKARRSSR